MSMKTLFTGAVLMVCASDMLYAQQGNFQGSVTDKEHHAVPGARVRISRGFVFIAEVQADNNGLYYTQLLPEGSYNIAVQADGRYEKSKRVWLKAANKYEHRFYNLSMTGKKLHVQPTDTDPFLTAKLKDPNPGDEHIYLGEVHAILKTDKNGKAMEETVATAPEPVPSAVKQIKR